MGHVECGNVEIGHVEIGHVETGHVQYGNVETGHTDWRRLQKGTERVWQKHQRRTASARVGRLFSVRGLHTTCAKHGHPGLMFSCLNSLDKARNSDVR